MLHASSVQPLLSLQTTVVPPVHPPAPSQWSPLVQALLSLQGVLFGWEPFGGQVLSTPLHTSATSQTLPFEGRHVVPEVATPSEGQAALVPSQLSATSQRSLEFRQRVPVAKTSGGHVMLVPLQTSA